MIEEDNLPIIIESTSDVNPSHIQKCIIRKNKISRIMHNTNLMEKQLREMSTIEHNYLNSNCDHEWVVDYNGSWGPCDHTPMICEKCKI